MNFAINYLNVINGYIFQTYNDIHIKLSFLIFKLLKKLYKLNKYITHKYGMLSKYKL